MAFQNGAIADAFGELIGKEPKDCKVAFIPTAANAERGDKGWLIDDMHNVRKRGYSVDVVELSALTRDEIMVALEDSDAVFVGGGNTFYLSYWLQERGLFELLPRLLDTRVYAGISAGSIVAGQSLVLASQAMQDEAAFRDEHYDEFGPRGQSSGRTFRFVDFVFRPHLNSRFFPLVNVEELKERTKNLDSMVYALDDASALKVVDGQVEVVGTGEWVCLSKGRLHS